MKFFTKMVRALSGRTGESRRSPTRTPLQLQRLEARDVPSAYGDFNGDGYDDLAIGVPGEDVGTAGNAGAVNVLYGSHPHGLTSNLNQFWHQDSPGIEGVAGASDGFGRRLGRRK